MSTSTPPSAPTLERVLLVRIGGERLAVDGRYVRGVVPVETVIPVPRAPGHVLGVFHHLGRIVPYVDVQPALGLPSRGPLAANLSILMEVPPFLIAAAIDEVVGFEGTPPDSATPGPGHASGSIRSLAKGTVTHDGEPYILLDAAKLLESLRIH